jgi:hypothetical protein
MSKIAVWAYYVATSFYMCTKETPTTYFLFYLAQYGLICYLSLNPKKNPARKSLFIYAGLLFCYNVLLINRNMPTFCKYASSQLGGILFSVLAFILILITFLLCDDKSSEST